MKQLIALNFRLIPLVASLCLTAGVSAVWSGNDIESFDENVTLRCETFQPYAEAPPAIGTIIHRPMMTSLDVPYPNLAIYEVATGESVATSISDPVYMSVSPNNHFLAVLNRDTYEWPPPDTMGGTLGDLENTVRQVRLSVYEVETSSLLNEYEWLPGRSRYFGWLDDNHLLSGLASQSAYTPLIAINIANGESELLPVTLPVWSNASSQFYYVASDGYGRYVAFVDDQEGGLAIARMDDGSVVWHGTDSISSQYAYVTNVSWSPDGQKLAFVDDRDPIQVGYFDVSDSQSHLLTTWSQLSSSYPYVFNLKWSPGGDSIAYWRVGTQGVDTTARLIMTKLDSLETIDYCIEANIGNVGSILWSPDGDYFALSTTDADINSIVVNVETGERWQTNDNLGYLVVWRDH